MDPDGLPEGFGYDADGQRLHVGSGAFEGVTERMRSYDVGGWPVLDRWLGARGAKRNGGRRGPLDEAVKSERWPLAWSSELVRLLSVLRHLTALEPVQEKLLDQVLSGPLIDVAELERRDVLPVPRQARKPRPAASVGEALPGLDEVEAQERHVVRPIVPARDRAAEATRRGTSRSRRRAPRPEGSGG